MPTRRAAIILAAGKGKRMRSDIPKVLHQIHGRPIIGILMDTLTRLDFEKIVVVVGFKGEMVVEALAGYPVTFAWQPKQHGTGHAVQMTRDALGGFDGTTLIALGDVPFLSVRSLEHLMAVHEQTGAAVTCLSAVLDDPSGYGRVVRVGNSNQLEAIIEEKDATQQQRRICEVNTGTMCFQTGHLFEAIDEVDNQNAQGEYYLTDTINILHNKGLRVSVMAAENPDEVLGVNSVEQLALLAEKFASRWQAR